MSAGQSEVPLEDGLAGCLWEFHSGGFVSELAFVRQRRVGLSGWVVAACLRFCLLFK